MYQNPSVSWWISTLFENCKADTEQYVSAIGEYPIRISNGELTLLDPKALPKIIALANNTAITDETVRKLNLVYQGMTLSTLAGIANAAALQYTFTDGVFRIPGTNECTSFTTSTSSINIFGFSIMSGGFEGCIPHFADPRDKIIGSLNHLMVRAGIYWPQTEPEPFLERWLDDGLGIHTNYSAIPLSKVPVFKSDFNYFAAAAVLELCTILAILYCFFGFWQLGRDVSFSPLELAKVGF